MAKGPAAAESDGSGELTICCHVEYGARLAVRHLLESGHRHIGHISREDPHNEDVLLKFAGYRTELAAAGIPFSPDWTTRVDGGYNEATGYEGAMRLLRSRRRPTAIFALCDILAAGCLRAARELGLRVPDDVSVMGYDDKEYAALLHPSLTTVRTPFMELGRSAMECLIARIEGEEAPVESPIYPVLVGRESVRTESAS